MIQSDSHKKMNEYLEKLKKVYKVFIFMGHAFWTEDVEDRVKLLESNALNCCLKITTTDLSKIVLK